MLKDLFTEIVIEGKKFLTNDVLASFLFLTIYTLNYIFHLPIFLFRFKPYLI